MTTTTTATEGGETMPDVPTHGPRKPRGTKPSPEAVKRLYSAGESRNSTARKLGVSTRQVDYVAADLGIAWSAEATRDATAWRREAAEADRAEAAQLFRELTLDSLARALAEDDASDRRRHALVAESAARSDLAIFNAHREVDDGSEAAEDFGRLLQAIRGGSDQPVDDQRGHEQQLDPDDDD